MLDVLRLGEFVFNQICLASHAQKDPKINERPALHSTFISNFVYVTIDQILDH